MALSKIDTAGLAADAVDNTILDLAGNYAFTGTVTGAGAAGYTKTAQTTTNGAATYSISSIPSGTSELILFGEKAALQFPEKVIIKNIIGAGYTALNQFSNAINHYKAALKLEPKNAEVLNNLGLTFKAIGDFKKANECFENSISIKPNFAEAFNNMALSLKEERKFEKAIVEFGEGLQKYPDSIKGPDNMLKLGLSFANLKKPIIPECFEFFSSLAIG